MLGKLIKYDVKWINKVLVVYYALIFIFAITGRILSNFDATVFYIISQVCFGATIAMAVNIVINNLIRMWVRFLRNIYKDESYLTHTLPIKRQTIYLSKILSGIITMFISIVVVLINIAICYYSKENLNALKISLEMIASSYNSTVNVFLLSISLAFFLEMIAALLAGYCGIIIGHRAEDGKMVKSFISGFIFYLAFQLLTLGIIFIIGLFNNDIMALFISMEVNVNAIKSIMNIGIITYIIYNIILYHIGKKQFEKGVNVE